MRARASIRRSAVCARPRPARHVATTPLIIAIALIDPRHFAMMLRWISVGARVERAADGVAQIALDPLLGHVAVTAEDLHGVEHRSARALPTRTAWRSTPRAPPSCSAPSGSRCDRRAGGRCPAARACPRCGWRPTGTCRSACRTASGCARARCTPRAAAASRRESSPRMQPRSHSIEHSKTSTPRPSRPSRFSTGTRQSSKTTSAIGDVRRPIFSRCLPTVRPGRVALDDERRDAHRRRAPDRSWRRRRTGRRPARW